MDNNKKKLTNTQTNKEEKTKKNKQTKTNQSGALISSFRYINGVFSLHSSKFRDYVTQMFRLNKS
jgi:hypothetical protein